MDIVIPGCKIEWFNLEKGLIVLDIQKDDGMTSLFSPEGVKLHVGQKVTLMLEQRVRKPKVVK